MERQVHRLVHLVDDLLDVSRISRGVVELRKEYVLLSSILDNAIETSMPLIDKAHHDLQIALQAEPIMLEADPTRLSQVFSDLLDNAAKYPPARGRITLSARRAGDPVIVSVKDSGIGIPRDMLPRVFDMFRQVNHELTHTHGGGSVSDSRLLATWRSGTAERWKPKAPDRVRARSSSSACSSSRNARPVAGAPRAFRYNRAPS